MNHEQFVEYTRLNLRHKGLKRADIDKETAAKFENAISAVRIADRTWASLPDELKQKREEGGLYFSSMGLTYWALLVCLPLLAMFMANNLKEGTPLMVGEWFFAFAYILPAIFLVVRLFLFSFVNIAHLILLVLCAIMTLLQVRIFGSEVNWMWIFIAGGTALTLVGRVWEYFHKVRRNKRWYKEQVAKIRSGEPAISRAQTLFNAIGAEAADEMAQKFPGNTPGTRNAFFDFSRKLQRDDKAEIPPLPTVDTDFIHAKESSETVRETEERTVRTIVTVTDQSLGYQSIGKQAALNQFITPGKVKPFFGMAAPELLDDLQYRIYAHRWNVTVEYQIQNHYIQTTRVKNRAKQQAQWDMETAEWHYLGTSASNAQLHTSSWGENALYQDYLSKKKALLDQIPDTIGIERYNTDSHCTREQYKHFEVAMLEVRTPDGSLVGLYSGESREAINFCAMAAKQNWGAEISAAACAGSEVQKAYLYHRFII